MRHKVVSYGYLESRWSGLKIPLGNKDGDRYISAHKNLNNVYKDKQKNATSFKPSIHNVISTGTNIAKYGSLFAKWAMLGSQDIVVKSTAAIFYIISFGLW